MGIQFKRRVGSSGAPTGGSLLAGELALNTDDQIIYTSSNGSDIVAMGGVGTVTEVNGNTGPVVTLVTDDILEDGSPTNLWYTQGRFDTAFGAKTTDGLTEGSTNKYYSSALFDTSFSGKSTTDLSEGANLYYTEARGIATFNTQLGLNDTDALAEGSSNLYYTDGRVSTYVTGTMINDSASTATGLYSSQKIDALVSGSLNYLGAWDAATNNPVLADGSGTANDFYKVSVAGTINLGSGSITFNEGDDVIYNGTIWERFGSSNAVDSVNTKTGAVVLDTDDISEGSTNLYYTQARTLADVAGAGYGIINDGGQSLTEVWSSSYMTTIIGNVTEIDDGVDNTSTTKTWSASKIAANYMPIDVDYGTY